MKSIQPEVRTVALRYQLSDWTLFSVERRLQVRAFGLDDRAVALDQLDTLQADADGLMLRSLPVGDDILGSGIQKVVVGGQHALRYILQRFPRYYIDMSQSFADYKAKFSGKTRSTLNRKLKKFGGLNSGQIHWERFTRPEELERFWTLARDVSAKTYQERLLDAGLPQDAAYFEEAKRLASADNLRAFLLFDGDRPVSYLYCPIHKDIVNYAYLGYDPEYLRLSVGTVLQWLALESLFTEQRFRFFDFTEGESEHKRLFSTACTQCANVALLKPTPGNWWIAHSHLQFNRATQTIGNWLEKRDLKARIKRWLRFGRTGG